MNHGCVPRRLVSTSWEMSVIMVVMVVGVIVVMGGVSVVIGIGIGIGVKRQATLGFIGKILFSV